MTAEVKLCSHLLDDFRQKSLHQAVALAVDIGAPVRIPSSPFRIKALTLQLSGVLATDSSPLSLSRTCPLLQAAASPKVTVTLGSQPTSSPWSAGWVQRSGFLASTGTSLRGQHSSRGPMGSSEVSGARYIVI